MASMQLVCLHVFRSFLWRFLLKIVRNLAIDRSIARLRPHMAYASEIYARKVFRSQIWHTIKIRMKTGGFSVLITNAGNANYLKFTEPPENLKLFFSSKALVKHVNQLRYGVDEFMVIGKNGMITYERTKSPRAHFLKSFNFKLV